MTKSYVIDLWEGGHMIQSIEGTSAKSLIRMLGPHGNFGIIGYLQKQAGVELHVSAGPS